MAFSFQQKFDKSKEDRSIAVSSKNAIVQARADVLEEDQFNNVFLHGDSNGNIGINDLIWYWLYEKGLEGGNYYLRPVLDSSLEHWRDDYESVMSNAVHLTGEKPPPEMKWWQRKIPDERYLNGFYPPDGEGDRAKDLNWETDYLNANGDSRPGDSTWGFYSQGDSDGFLFHLYGLYTTLGYSPTRYPWGAGDSQVSPYKYLAGVGAELAAKKYLYGSVFIADGEQRGTTMLGRGLLGRRRADTDIDSNFSAGWRYVIGNNSENQPTFYADSSGDENGFLDDINYKTNFLTTLNNVCEFGDSSSTYIAHLNSLATQLALIDSGTNILFAAPEMSADIGDSAFNVTDMIDKLSRYIGHSGDVWVDVGSGDSSLWGLYNYFNGAVGNESEFNDGLDLCKFLSDSTRTLVYNRYTALDNGTIMGVGGDEEGDFTGGRFWRSFWVKTRIGKTKGTLLSWIALATSERDSIKELADKNQQLQIILGDTTWDHYEYIPTPSILASFYDPKLDQDTGALIIKKVTSVFDGQQHASEYVISRKLYTTASSTAISNDPWGDTYYYDTITSIDPDTRFVLTTYTDFGQIEYAGDSVQEEFQELFLYKHQLFSTRDLKGDTVQNIILEPKYFDYGDTSAYPLGSGDTRYINPVIKPWTGLGDSSEVTGFWGETINLVRSPEYIIGDTWGTGDSADDWYFDSNCYSEMSSYYFNDKRFTYISSNVADADIKQRIGPGTFGDTLAKTFTGTFMKREIGDSGDTSSIYLIDWLPTFYMNLSINWIDSTITLIEGDTATAEWYGDSIVKVFVKTNPLGDIGDTHALIVEPQEGTIGNIYATALQLEENPYPRPYVNGTREMSSLGYSYTWGDSGAIETWVYPRFSFDAPYNKWIFSDYDGADFTMGLNYDRNIDKFRYTVANVSGGAAISSIISAGINASGDSGDTAFVGDTYLHQWHHFKVYWKFYGDSITYGDTKIFKLFYNGNFVGGDSSGDSIVFQNKLSIGSIPFYTSPANYVFNGEITDFMIWDYGDTSTTHYDNGNPYFYPDPFPTDTNYLYRTQTVDKDNKVGGDNTKSLQSNMYDPLSPREFTAISGDSVLELGDSHEFRKNEYVVVNGTSNSNGYYFLTRTEDTNIFVSPTLGADTSGTVYPTASVVFIQE